MMSKKLEAEFDEAMLSVYRRARDEAGYNPTRFLQMVSELGGLQAARVLLQDPGIPEGLSELWLRKRLDISMEAIVLDDRWRPLFTNAERDTAKNRLIQLGYSANRWSAVFWVPWLLWNRLWIPAFLLALHFGATSTISVWLDPVFFSRDALQRGDRTPADELEAILAISETLHCASDGKFRR